MNGREEEFVYLMVMIEGVWSKAAHNPKAAFLSLRKGVEATCHYHKFITMENDLYARFGTSLATMNHLCAQHFADLEIAFV